MGETPEQLWERARGALRTPPVEEWPFAGPVAPRELPDERAAELGPLLRRVDRAVRAVGDIGNVHVCRWGDGVEHFHVWFMARPVRMPQLSTSLAAIRDDVLPPLPEAVWRENMAAVADAMATA